MNYAHVMLGAKVSASGKPSNALRRRAWTAAQEALSGRAKFVILSGGGVPSEAMVALELLQDERVPPEMVHLEEDASTTCENVLHSWEIAQAAGYDGLILVSDGYHLPRARLAAKILGIPVQGIPVLGEVLPSPPLDKLRAIGREILATPGTISKALTHRLGFA
jgi:uncharacterized SAM-binding protein YcdF (DUF218 family)